MVDEGKRVGFRLIFHRDEEDKRWKEATEKVFLQMVV